VSFTHRPTHNTHTLSLSLTHTLSKSTIDEGVKIETKIGEEPNMELKKTNRARQTKRMENEARWKNGAR
jgi:hypothetical protein